MEKTHFACLSWEEDEVSAGGVKMVVENLQKILQLVHLNCSKLQH